MDRRDAALIPRAGDLPGAGGGLLDRAEETGGLQPRQRHRDAARGGRDRAARHRGARARSSRRSSCCSCSPSATAWGRSSSAAWQGRAEADRVLADRAGAVPAGAVRVREDGRARHGLRGRPVRGLADDLGLDRRRVGPDQPPRPAGRAGPGLPRRDPDRLRRHVHLRHDRLGDRARADRAEADRRGPAGRLRRVREADGWRPGRPGPGRVLRRTGGSRCARTGSTPRAG